MKFHHLGIACRSIEESCEFVEKIFSVVHKSAVVFDQNQNAHLCILKIEDGSRIELVSGPMVSGFVKKGHLLYHSCWEVEDIDSEIDKLIASGASLISPPQKAILFNNRLVAFLITPIGILELLGS